MKTKMKQALSGIMAIVLLVSSLAFSVNAGTTLVWPVPGHTTRSQDYLGEGIHDGIDISDGSIYGADIVAAMSGTVKYKYTCTQNHVGDNCCDGFGTGLIIYGDDGRWYQYAHMLGNSIPSSVYVNAYVTAGTKIGQVGNTGNSTGAHLHFEINLTNGWHGSVDPMLETYTDNTIQISAPAWASLTIKEIRKVIWDERFYGGSSVSFDCKNDSVATDCYLYVNKYNESTGIYESFDSFHDSQGGYDGLIIDEIGKYEAYIVASNSSGQVTSNKVYFKIGYFLTYDVNGGVGEIPEQSGETSYIITDTIPTREGYVFLGWSSSSDDRTGTYFAGEKVSLSKHRTLYAVWREEGDYTLKYDSRYSSNVSGIPETQTGAEGYVVSYSCPTRDGYIFMGWDTNYIADTVQFKPGDTINISEDITLYAVWEADESTITYNITYDANGGIGAPEPQIGTGVYAISTVIPTREGYVFQGWSKEPSYMHQGEFFVPGLKMETSANVVLYAIWTPADEAKTYTFTFDANGGSGAPESISSTIRFVVAPEQTPVRPGYTFRYWMGIHAFYRPGGPIDGYCGYDLKAYWDEGTSLFYNANGGSGAPYSQTGEITYTVSSVKPVRKGYVFRGWSTDRDATTAEYQAGDKISLTKNTTLQAVWVPEHECAYSSVITVQPTCTKPGQRKYTCSTCDDNYTEAIPVLPHNIVTDKAVAATCTSTGKTEGKHCYECGTVTVLQTVIPVKEHTAGSWEITVAPTYKAEGTQVKKCTVCKTVLEECVVPMLEKAPRVEINRTSTTAINYGDTLVLTLDEIEIPEGYAIEWFVEGAGVSTKVNADGTECRVTSIANGSATITAKLVDENGEPVTDEDNEEISDEIAITSKAGFFQKLISFFKNLFGANRIIY